MLSSMDAACTATLGLKPYSRLPEKLCIDLLSKVLAAALPLLIYVNRPRSRTATKSRLRRSR